MSRDPNLTPGYGRRRPPGDVPPQSGPVVDDVARLAVIRASALGDFIQALPALEALRAAYPRAEIVLVGTGTHAAIVEGRSSPVDRVIPLPVGAVWHAGRALAAHGDPTRPLPGTPPDIRPAHILDSLRAERFDLVVQLHGGGGESNPVASALGARVTAGAHAPGAPRLDRSIPFLHYQSELLRALEIVGLVGAPPVSLDPRVPVTDRDRAAARDVLPPDGPYAVLHPGATDPRRRWGPDRFAGLGDALAEHGLRVVVTGTGPDEASIADDVASGMRHAPVVLVDRLSLSALVGILGGARLTIANDTGPLHLATAVGTPTVGVFWIGNLVTGGPAYRTRSRPAISWRTTCPRCGADATETRGCDHPDSFVDDVSLERVLELAADFVGGEEDADRDRSGALVSS